jgi:hypothetical protein
MQIGAISASSLSQYVQSAGTSDQLQQLLQALQESLSSGDLNAASSQFADLQKLFQDSATGTGSTLASNSQLSSDLTALGNALGSNDLSAAQSAFATLEKDLKSNPAPAQTNEATAASQSVQLVEELLGTVNTSGSSSGSDLTTSVLEQVYGSKGSLNVLA